MRALLTVFAAVGLAVVLVSGLCESNTPPDKPTITGPSSAGDGDTLTFRVTVTDPEGDNVEFKLDYGDGTTAEWTAVSYSSGMTISRKYAYPDTGSYEVKVMARDEEELESEWSDPLTVTCKSPGRPPEASTLSAISNTRPPMRSAIQALQISAPKMARFTTTARALFLLASTTAVASRALTSATNRQPSRLLDASATCHRCLA